MVNFLYDVTMTPIGLCEFCRRELYEHERENLDFIYPHPIVHSKCIDEYVTLGNKRAEGYLGWRERIEQGAKFFGDIIWKQVVEDIENEIAEAGGITEWLEELAKKKNEQV